jgi:hypothetical protein
MSVYVMYGNINCLNCKVKIVVVFFLFLFGSLKYVVFVGNMVLFWDCIFVFYLKHKLILLYVGNLHPHDDFKKQKNECFSL